MLNLNSNQIYSQHNELKAAFVAANNAANGFAVGDADIMIADQLDDIAAELGLPFVDTSRDLCDDSIFVFASYDEQRIVLVGDANGAWAVEVEGEIR